MGYILSKKHQRLSSGKVIRKTSLGATTDIVEYRAPSDSGGVVKRQVSLLPQVKVTAPIFSSKIDPIKLTTPGTGITVVSASSLAPTPIVSATTLSQPSSISQPTVGGGSGTSKGGGGGDMVYASPEEVEVQDDKIKKEFPWWLVGIGVAAYLVLK